MCANRRSIVLSVLIVTVAVAIVSAAVGAMDYRWNGGGHKCLSVSNVSERGKEA